MVGKKTFDKILASLTIFFACLVSSCHTSQYMSQNIYDRNICGTYVFNQVGHQDEILESDTLVLKTDGTYHSCTYLEHKDLNDMDVYPTKGTWSLCGNFVILNSVVPCEDDSCFIRVLESDIDDDSIVIEIIRLSTGKPISNYTVLSIYDEQYDSLVKTDSCGMAIFRRERTSLIDISDPNGMRIVSPPKMGYMYRVYYRDCYLRIHNNEKLFFKGNALVMSKKEVIGYSKFGRKKYKTCEYPYVKVPDTLGL